MVCFIILDCPFAGHQSNGYMNQKLWWQCDLCFFFRYSYQLLNDPHLLREKTIPYYTKKQIFLQLVLVGRVWYTRDITVVKNIIFIKYCIFESGVINYSRFHGIMGRNRYNLIIK